MDFDDYWEILPELLPTLPLYLGVLVGAIVVQAAVRRYQRAVMRHGTALVACGLTGELVARRLLTVCALDGVRLACLGLRDLYHPWKREIRLTPCTFQSASLGALATAAHEVGHAQQFAEGILLCRLRQFIWPVCWALTGVAFLFPLLPFLGVSLFSFEQSSLILVAVAVLTLSLQLPIMLPLERDASRRAKRLTQESGLLSPSEMPGFEAILKSAWLTYVAVEVQRWTLVLAAGIVICYSPVFLGEAYDPAFEPGSIESVHIVDEPQVGPTQPDGPLENAPLPWPSMPSGGDWETGPAGIPFNTGWDAADEAPMTYLEAILPSLVILGVLLLACFVLTRFLNLKPSSQSSCAQAIDRSNAGLALCEQGAYGQAIAEFTRSLELDPTLAAALYNRGHTSLKMGRLDEAMRDLDAALVLAPNLVQALVARADVWQKRGDSARALEEYDTAHRLAPQNAVVLSCRGFTWLKRQEYDRALADFDHALQLNPQDSWSCAGRGLVWLAQGEVDRALAESDRAVGLGGGDSLPYTARGRVRLAKDDRRGAIADFTEALRREPAEATVLRDRGLAHYLDGAFDLAVADLSASVRLDAADSVSWNNYGAALFGAGEYTRADEALRESIRLAPAFANPYKHLAWLQAACTDSTFRDGAQAVANATRALELAEWKPTEWLSVLAAAHAEAGNVDEAEKLKSRCSVTS